ncbi:MAG: hypothetical protein H6559_00135 [Lewinellaceae bacterium]|nr:hypothetical protein [Lewinellaceae bacterium]
MQTKQGILATSIGFYLKASCLLLLFQIGQRGVGFGQSWRDFAHPAAPHEIGNPLPPLVFEELFDDTELVLTVPMVVVLMDFVDQPSINPSRYSPSRFRNMAFGQDLPDGSPTVREYYRQASNGRIQVIPAQETHGLVNDGVIGWVAATNGNAAFNQNLAEKRAEAVRRADAFMNFSDYDANDDGVISAHELIIFLVNPGSGGGQTWPTNPASIPVDGGALMVNIPIGALGETNRAMPIAHETSHPFLGHTDLYRKCTESWPVGDGYICEILSDDCRFPNNTNCSCPDALDATADETATGNTSAYPVSSEAACGGAAAINGAAAWYEVYGNGNTFTASTCGAGTGFNTQITVFCNGCEALTCVAGSRDDPDCFNPSASTVSWCTRPGASYLIAVHGDGGQSGPFFLRVSDEGTACSGAEECGLAAAHARHWYPYNSNWMGIMSSGFNNQNTTPITLDPWSKIHLGFTQPRILTHDGTYTVYAEEPVRTIGQQHAQPEAYIVYDPQKPLSERYREYFIIESRNDPALPDQGLAIWLINEDATPFPDGGPANYRRIVRLIHQGGHNPASSRFLWDGGSFANYDFAADSSPRNSAWTDGTPSYVEVYDISESGERMQFSVQIPPIFVDDSNLSLIQRGSQQFPFRRLPDGVDNITTPPRTILIGGGSYPGAMTIDTPCLIKHWRGGAAIIGN